MEANKPKISVIMPVYNAAPFLNESINSILKQTYKNFEFLIFDDASTDNSLAIIKSFIDSRIRIIESSVNLGYVRHLNAGLAIAKGEYIARMDADDIALPSRFEQQVELLNTHLEIGICGSAFEAFGKSTEVISNPQSHNDIFTQLFLEGSAFGHPTTMIRKDVLKKNGLLYKEQFMPAEDYDLWCELAKCTQLYNLKEVLLRYRVHENNVSIIKREKQLESINITKQNMIAYIGNLRTDSDVDEIRLLFNFIHCGYENEKSLYTKYEVKYIFNFFEKVKNCEFVVWEKFIQKIGKRRYFIYNLTKHSIFIYYTYFIFKKLKNFIDE